MSHPQILGAAELVPYPIPKSWVLQDGEALVEVGLENAPRSLEFGLSAELRISEGSPSTVKGPRDFHWKLVKVYHGMEAAAPELTPV